MQNRFTPLFQEPINNKDKKDSMTPDSWNGYKYGTETFSQIGDKTNGFWAGRQKSCGRRMSNSTGGRL